MKILVIFLLIPVLVGTVDENLWDVGLTRIKCLEENGCLPISVPTPGDYDEKNAFLDGIFTAVAPAVIRRGKPFNIAITGFRLRQSTKLALEISGTTSSGSKLKLKKFAKISKQQPKSFVQFSTFNIPNGTYELCIVTDRGYSATKSLTYIENEFSFLIQTDKSVYFPNDNIRFRIFTIDSETKSVNPTANVDVSILDGIGNAVTKFSGVKFIKGKFQGELKLSDRAPVGLWQIYVESNEDSSSKEFEVASYEVPVIYAALIIPESIPFSLRKLPVRIDTKYSFNDEVDGIATVIFERYGTEYFRKEAEIKKSTANLEIDVLTDLKAVSSQPFSYDVRLVFNDQFTNTTVTDFKSFTVVPASYKIILTGDAILEPDRPFEYEVVLQKYDGSPAPNGTTVTVTASPYELNQTLQVDANGSARSSFTFPANSSYVKISATATDAYSVNFTSSLPFPHQNQSVPLLRLEVVTKNAFLDAPVQVEVLSSELVSSLMCHLSAKGILLNTTEVPVYNSTKKLFKFSFTPSIIYAPTTNVICYYVKRNGQVVTGSISLELRNNLTNYVTLSVKRAEYKPNDTFEVQVESKLFSTVSLVAVDQRIIALRDGHSVSKPEIFDSLQKYYRVAAVRSTNNAPGYEFSFNVQGLLLFTNIPPPEDCADNEYPQLSIQQKSSNNPVLGSNHKTSVNYGDSFFWLNVDVKTRYPNDTTSTRGLTTVREQITTGLGSYVVYGVAMNVFQGIGLQTSLPSSRIFRPFFITADFAYSIKRTEILTVSLTVYNFLKQSQVFTVKINKDPKYEIAYGSTFGWTDAGTYYVRTLTSVVGLHSRLKFALKGVTKGFINFDISATGPLAGDSITRVLKIEPFDVIKASCDSKLITLQDGGTALRSLKCTFPTTLMENLENKASVAGNILGRNLDTYASVDGLINMPGGCGEQILLYMVPDVVTYLYLEATYQLSPRMRSTLISYITYGYLNELNYRRRDGAFSAWGENSAGSTWLTAYAGWAFALSRNIISVDSLILSSALDYLRSRQQADGSFVERAPIYHREMQGGSSRGIAMTAFVVNYIKTVLKDFNSPQNAEMYRKAITYLEENWWRNTDSYQLAIIGYALQSAGSPKANNVMNFFYMRRRETDTEIYFQNVETTAYCLLMVLVRGDRMLDALKLARYLVRVRNINGGFAYTQDTVMAMFALSRFGIMSSYDGSIDLLLTPSFGPTISRSITYSNTLKSEIIPLHINATKMNVRASATNKGFVTVSLQCQYRAESLDFVPAFQINHQFTYTCKNKIFINLQVKFLLANQSSGMAIVTVDLPSGFEFTEVVNSPAVRLAEKSSNGEVVTLYFDNIGNVFVPVTLGAIRTKFVEGVKGGRVSVVDYYNPANEAYLSFVLPDLTTSCGNVMRK